MNNLMKQKLEEFKSRKSFINATWFEKFFTMLEQTGVDNDTIIDAMDFAFSDEIFSGYKISGYKNPLSMGIRGQIANEEFFKYMSEMSDKLGQDKFKTFLETSLTEIQQDFKTYKEGNHSAKTNFINLFMKRLVIENPQDVKIETSDTKIKDVLQEDGSGRIATTIAGIEVGHISYDREDIAMPTISFTDFRTLPGLERLGLGTYMFTKFCMPRVR